jgi:hypothetical protein
MDTENSVCEHEWTYDQAVIPTYPPIQRKVCLNCFKLEHSQGIQFDDQQKFLKAYEQHKANYSG